VYCWSESDEQNPAGREVRSWNEKWTLERGSHPHIKPYPRGTYLLFCTCHQRNIITRTALRHWHPSPNISLHRKEFLKAYQYIGLFFSGLIKPGLYIKKTFPCLCQLYTVPLYVCPVKKFLSPSWLKPCFPPGYVGRDSSWVTCLYNGWSVGEISRSELASWPHVMMTIGSSDPMWVVLLLTIFNINIRDKMKTFLSSYNFILSDGKAVGFCAYVNLLHIIHNIDWETFAPHIIL